MAVFPKLKQPAPKLANHNRSHYFRTSMAVGPLYPIRCIPVNPGDDLGQQFESLVNTQALLSPLYGSFKLKIMGFFAGTSLYIPKLWRNGSMQQTDGTLDANYPVFQFPTRATSDIPNLHAVSPTNVLSYLGYAPGYTDVTAVTSSRRLHNLIPILMLWDIFRHYFANRQEVQFPYSSTVTGSNIVMGYENLSVLDDFFLNLPTNGGLVDLADLPEPIRDAIEKPELSMCGLPMGTYLPDRMNVILNKDFYEKNVTSVQVSTVGDSFQIDQLVTAKKLWNSRNKDAMTSGTFKDWVRVHFGVTPKIMDDMPTFLGATSSDIVFEDIRANTSANFKVGDVDATQYLGDKASAGKGYGRSRRFHCVADRPGYLMVLAQIVPKVDYFQGLERYTMFTKLSDEFRPEFNNIGLQDVLISDLNADFSGCNVAFATGPGNLYKDPATLSVGKQPAWIEYMTAVNKVRGTFCSTERSWVLARDMRSNPSEQAVAAQPSQNTSISAYIDPSEWNQPFAVQGAGAQNFLVQFYIREIVRSTVLKRLMPKF